MNITFDRWLVFFGEGHVRAPWWIRATTRPAWRHCFAMAFDPERDVWLMFWPTWWNLEIRLVPADWVTAWIAAAKRGQFRVLQVEAAPPAVRAGGPRLVMGCSSAIGWLLGLPGWQLRPATLHRHLLGRGAKEVFRPDMIPPDTAIDTATDA